MSLGLVADFETTTNPDDCRVWAWAVADIETESMIAYDTDIQSFFRFIATYDKVMCYFHNLSFDAAFMFDYLLKHNYVHVDSRRIKPREFTTLISDDGKHYSVKIMFGNKHTVEFRDSLKLIPLPVAKIPEAFNLSDSKLDIDYTADRPIGHTLTVDEVDYIESDVVIVAKALHVQLNAGMRKMTVGSNSLAEYKRMTTEFTTLFPILDIEIDTDIRRAYRGGFTYRSTRFPREIIGPGRVFDVNSLYPSVMYDRLLPYGVPIWRDGPPAPDEYYPLFIVSLTMTAKLKREHIPCIQLRHSSFYVQTEYQTLIDEPVTLYATNVDLALWTDHYDIDVLEYHGGWYFQGATGMFCRYIDKWSKIKAEHTGGMRTIAKLYLNSLYGKFATNPVVGSKYPVLDGDKVRLVTGESETRKPVYTAMGVFITAYARDVTIRAAQNHYDIFAYADTDSLHLITDSDPVDLDIHPTRLGAWKREYIFEQALFLRAKAYLEYTGVHNCARLDGEHARGCGFETHIAGLPVSIGDQLEFDDIKQGVTIPGKLLPTRVNGGIVLREVGYTIKY